MPKRRSKGRFAAPKQQTYDSDDERAYQGQRDPDPSSREYMYDEVDEFHSEKEKILLEYPRGLQDAGSSADEEEVLGWDDDDEDEEEMVQENEDVDMSSDELEGQDMDTIPDVKAWGKKKAAYYHTDYVDDDLPGVSGSEEEDAQEEEEKEALALQQRMAQTLQDEDFGMELFKTKTKPVSELSTKEEQEKVIKDLTKLSKREKLELLKKESPELLELIEDFKSKLKEVIDKLQPLMNFVKEGSIGGKGAIYVQTKFQLYLNYCINISFYMILKSRHLSVHNHPVIGRLVAYRNLIKQLEPVDKQLEPEIINLLSGNTEDRKTKKVKKPRKEERQTIIKAKKSREISVSDKPKKKLSEMLDDSDEEREGDHGNEEKKVMETVPKTLKERKKRKADEQMFTSDEIQALNYYSEMKRLAKERNTREEIEPEHRDDDGENEEAEEDDETDPNTKRAITYEISKNKGLTPKRKKLNRNPRVKHREKYRKAKIRRKGQVREVRREIQRYGGEPSGIRAGVIKSIKIKT
ncbi:something about silencing protein 10-like isoform X1 [Glandiceps talaboti]